MKKIDNNRIEEVIKQVGLENRINNKVSKYSLGMKQRLGIAIALLNQPNLLILDEPTNGLDPEGIKDLRNILINLSQNSKIALFISSHNLQELENICTKICIIKGGKIVEQNTLSKLKSHAQTYYIFEVGNTKDLEKLIPNKKIEIINSQKFKIEINKENVFDIAKILEENNIKVYNMQEDNYSLEDAFLRKAGENKID